ncbi:MAG: SIR2 family protein [Chloroflexota bacterium]
MQTTEPPEQSKIEPHTSAAGDVIAAGAVGAGAAVAVGRGASATVQHITIYTAAGTTLYVDGQRVRSETSTPSAVDPLDQHFESVVKAIVEGRVVPFLGEGTNLSDRRADAQWPRDDAEYLPDGGELSAYLASQFHYPDSDKVDLLRVSQYVMAMNDSGPLRDALHAILDRDYPLTPLHQFFAQLPALLAAKNKQPRPLLIVTTNYDDLLERAYRQAGVPFDVVTYIAEGKERGKFMHTPHEGEPHVIAKPDEYQALPIEATSRALQRAIILKVHGAVDRANPEGDSYVIAEDHYIDYLAQATAATLLPKQLSSKIFGCHILFLGYNLRDWNLRAILQRIWSEQTFKYRSWAIQPNPPPLELTFWRKRGVDILGTPLRHYVDLLRARVQALPDVGGAP